MREIKFRGKNYGGIWLYGYLMPAEKPVINKGCKYRISVSPQACAGKDKMVYEVITDTIGQYTGLKDKNGRAIYEGDIISRKYTIGPQCCFSEGKEEINYIGFRQSECKFIVVCANRHHDLYEPYNIHVEVIGNIHDNPELL